MPSGIMTTFPVDAWISKCEEPLSVEAAGSVDVYVEYEFLVLSSSSTDLQSPPAFDGEVQLKLESRVQSPVEGTVDSGAVTLGTGGAATGGSRDRCCNRWVKGRYRAVPPVEQINFIALLSTIVDSGAIESTVHITDHLFIHAG